MDMELSSPIFKGVLMKKLLFVVWSLLLVAGNVFGDPKETKETKEVKSETKDIKEIKESAALNCGTTGVGGN